MLSGGPGNQPSTWPLPGFFLNASQSSTPWLCFVYDMPYTKPLYILQPASCQLGFLQPVFIYNVWDQIVCIDEMSPVGDQSVS